MIETFNDMKLPESVMKYINNRHFNKPTAIQCEVFEPMADNKDVIGCSKTGTGKTFAYILPMINRIEPNEDLQLLIISPTYELNHQIYKQFKTITEGINGFKVSLINGDGNIKRQIEDLKKKPQVIIGSCGRIRQLISERRIKCHKIKTFIIDEADKMLNKNNLDSVLDLRKCLLKYTQVCLFSASMDDKAIKTSGLNLLVDPIIINLSVKSNDKKSSVSRIPDTIEHIYVVCERNNRVESIRSICSALNPERCILFSNNSYELNKTYDKLTYHSYNIERLYGNASKNTRINAVKDFHNGNLQYLLSTDIAARGLHFDDITHIININLPEEINEYLHRAGRCGRNDNKGVCISLVTENELKNITNIEKRFKIKFKHAFLRNGYFVVK